MIDMKETIKQLEERCAMLGNPEYMEDAIKVMKMWRDIKYSASQWDVGKAPQPRLHCVIEAVEEKFFPSIISQGFKIKIEGESMAEIQLNAGKVMAVEGVKEVRMHDKDC